MKILQRLAGITIFGIIIIMTLVLFRPQPENEDEHSLEEIEYFYNEQWTVLRFEGSQVLAAEQEDKNGVQKLVKDALANGEGQEVDLPYAGESSAGDLVVFKNKLPKKYAGMTLKIFSADVAVRVILDDAELYRYGDFESGASQTEQLSGTREHAISIPSIFQEGELWIEIISPYPNAAAFLENANVVLGNMMMVGMVESDIVDIVSCLLLVIMAIILFVLALIRLYTRQPMRGELFLGLAGLDAGIYFFIATDTLSLFYGVETAYEILGDLRVLLPLFLALYFGRNLRTVYQRRFSILLWCMNIHAVLQVILQILHVWDHVNIEFMVAAAMAAVCVTAIVSLVQLDRQNQSRQALLTVLATLLLLLGEIANVISNTYFEDLRANIISQYSTVLFSIMMAAIHVFRLAREYRANAEESAKLLQEKVKVAREQNTQLIQAKKEADAAKKEALEANEAKGKFLAHMSHEIRTPINAVLGMDEMILRESQEQNVKEYAMDIYTAGQTLLSLINDILDFSKIESGKMEIVPVEYDVSSFIHDVANMTSQRAKNKNLEFQAEVLDTIPCRLYGDDVRIRQILTNLLTNAVKYTHEGTVWLRVQCRRMGETAILQFEVEDTGIGIKEEDLPKLSAEFERIEEDRNRNIEGTGLGMSITIQLLNLLGSKLKVESVYGKGSKFYFELEQRIVDATPIGNFESRVQQMAEDYCYETKFCAPDAKILVVDDNAVNRKVFRNLLKETQIQVTEAGGGMECLKLVQENQYDLIFLDHMMPDIDGVETLHRMKELVDYPCQDTPVIVLTANAVAGAREKYLSEGFDNFLSKPIVPDKLDDMIKRMLPEELLQEAAPCKQQGVLPQQAKSGGPEELVEALPQVDGLDWNYAWLHLPDLELLEYTVKEFYTQIDWAADSLQQAYVQVTEEKQLEPYRIQVHAMKSLAATVGIIPLAGLAKVLEYAARDGKIDVIQSMNAPFLEEWRSYRQKLQGVFGIGTSAGKEVTDDSLIQALVEMVRISMQEMDIDRADQLVGQLQEYEYPDEISQNIRKLAEAVTNLDTEETEHFADLLQEQMKK